METKMMIAAIAAAAATLCAQEINLVECPKCDKRMRITEKGANINLCRFQDDVPDEATLESRIAAMKARAARFIGLGQERATGERAAPLMGWSSWNTFAVNISEDLIADTARAMATNGLKEAGYLYVNIDDGFFYGHGEDGKDKLHIHPERFPNGLKPVADAIHALGLRAGIYSDVGADTCGSRYNGDKAGIGAGLYGHDADDCDYYFRECGFDFIKVDYCGGSWLKLDERSRYTEVSEAIRNAGGGKVRFNVCRWKYPGTWVAGIADSWRTTRDIRANWKSVKDIIKENLYLSAYASAGHYNDMDMLEVGHRLGQTKTDFGKHDTGLTEDEERTHFGLWCMLSSPLLIGCDVRSIPPETMALVTNPYLVAMNQNNGLGLQGYVVARVGDAYILVKDAFERYGNSRYVALCNLGDEETSVTLKASDIDLGGTVQAFDLVDKADVGEFEGEVTLRLAPHASKFYLLDAERRLERTRYEAETAFLTDYQELRDADIKGTATHSNRRGASNGVVVRNLGTRETNDLVWKDVRIMDEGERRLDFRIASLEARTFYVQIDGGKKIEVATSAPLPAPGGEGFAVVSLTAHLTRGDHTIRISNPDAPCPDFDSMTIISKK